MSAIQPVRTTKQYLLQRDFRLHIDTYMKELRENMHRFSVPQQAVLYSVLYEYFSNGGLSDDRIDCAFGFYKLLERMVYNHG